MQTKPGRFASCLESDVQQCPLTSSWLVLVEMKEQVAPAAELLPAVPAAAAASWPSACSSWPSWQLLEQPPVPLLLLLTDLVSLHLAILRALQSTHTFCTVSNNCLPHSHNLGIKACCFQAVCCVCTSRSFHGQRPFEGLSDAFACKIEQTRRQSCWPCTSRRLAGNCEAYACIGCQK